LSASFLDLTAILARAADKSRGALTRAEDDAQAWLEEVRSGARSQDKSCVTCGRGPPLEANHVAGRRHGDLTVPQCPPCHREFTEGQDLWDPRWQCDVRTPELDEALLLRGFHDLLAIKSRFAPPSRAGAYLSLADSLREQYARSGRKTL
jgi:hypothetical protein